jgi:hypothetical protein
MIHGQGKRLLWRVMVLLGILYFIISQVFQWRTIGIVTGLLLFACVVMYSWFFQTTDSKDSWFFQPPE